MGGVECANKMTYRENCNNPESSRRVNDPTRCQGAFYALRPEDLRRGASFPVGAAAWILPKL